jgi:hypothetical protein
MGGNGLQAGQLWDQGLMPDKSKNHLVINNLYILGIS